MRDHGERVVVNDTDGRAWRMVRQQSRNGASLACCLTVVHSLRPDVQETQLRRWETAWAGFAALKPVFDGGHPDLRVCADVLKSYGLEARLRGGKASDVREATRFPFIAALEAIVPNPDTSIVGGGHGIVVAGRTRAGNLICLDPRAGLREVTPSEFPAYTLGPPSYPFYRFRGDYVAAA